MSWEWIVRQLQGERLEIPKGAGRRVINIGLGHYQHDREGKPDVRRAILEILRDHGPMTTPELFDQLAMTGLVTTPDALMHYCNRLLKRGQLSMTKGRRRMGGKGVNVWSATGGDDEYSSEAGDDA